MRRTPTDGRPRRTIEQVLFERRVRQLEEAERQRRMEAARSATEATQNLLPRTDASL